MNCKIVGYEFKTLEVHVALQGFNSSQIQTEWSVEKVRRGEGLSLMNIARPGKVYMSPLPIITRTQ